MSKNADTLLRNIVTFVQSVSPEVVELVCDELDRVAESGKVPDTAALVRVATQPGVRSSLSDLLGDWSDRDATMRPDLLSWALRAAVAADESRKSMQTVELVWTGPSELTMPLRRTEQALLEVVESAKESLLLVTFAAYKVPRVSDALAKAARRGVKIVVVVESPEASEGKVAFGALQALGKEVAGASRVYVWPLEKRPRDGQGRHGSMHVKCVVADASSVFVSSANLTGFAHSLNMELGILIRGGEIPAVVSEHVLDLISGGQLVEM